MDDGGAIQASSSGESTGMEAFQAARAPCKAIPLKPQALRLERSMERKLNLTENATSVHASDQIRTKRLVDNPASVE